MNKYIPIYLYGTVTILEGIFLLFSNDGAFNVIKLSLGISLSIGALLAFIAAFARQKHHVQFTYHELHALAMLAYGIAILAFCDTPEKLISFTAFLFIFYAFSEIIFCTWLFNLKQRVVSKIVFIRLLLGLVVGIGTIFAMNYSDFSIEIFGALFVMVGINILLYAPVMKANSFTDVSQNLSK